ncbi:predicted protein [Streptomyces viridosporus ATCC 14672]|uniref:Predicted protein n=1 Tax=Streptomyces viridosporus (strain ATCC 14672 / DSM 40746 / JCM 4963 / KCTC 9882 / NRRL B-12104 / FH 1290) TaxID=566461 RepID=D5ZSI8_STRV1|nr:predicted protein [Streptomyces viridosporus ATCC 14672]
MIRTGIADRPDRTRTAPLSAAHARTGGNAQVGAARPTDRTPAGRPERTARKVTVG